MSHLHLIKLIKYNAAIMTKKNQGFEITEKDIDIAMRYLKFTKGDENPTREKAIEILEDHLDLSHMLAHRIVEDEQSGKIEKVELAKDVEEKLVEEDN
jgi:hypothetical protein